MTNKEALSVIAKTSINPDEIANAQNRAKEDTDMADSKAITFEVNGTKYNSNEKGNRFYKTIGTQKVRISEAEWLSAMDAYNAECDSHLPNWAEVDEWEAEADAERQAREDKIAADAKQAEEAVAKKTKKKSKKNVAFTFEDAERTRLRAVDRRAVRHPRRRVQPNGTGSHGQHTPREVPDLRGSSEGQRQEVQVLRIHRAW